MIKGIDVSHWQNLIDFERVKAAGFDFVIIKAGGSDYGFYTDKMFKTNYAKAKAAGLKVGAYYFVGKKFLGEYNGAADGARFVELLKGMQFEFPVFLDVETTDIRLKKEATDAAIAFCDVLEKAGYFVGIYGSDVSGFKERLEHDRLKKYTHWVARYGSKEPEQCPEWQIWQFSSKGTVPGISGSVDLDVSKIDYINIMKERGLNGFPKPVKKVEETQEEKPKENKKKAKKAQKEV